MQDDVLVRQGGFSGLHERSVVGDDALGGSGTVNAFQHSATRSAGVHFPSLPLWVSCSGCSQRFVSLSSPQRSSLCIWHLCGCLVEENDVIFRDWQATCRACWFDSGLSQGSVFPFPGQAPLLPVSLEEPSLLAVGPLCISISP